MTPAISSPSIRSRANGRTPWRRYASWSAELDYAADPVLRLHQLEAPIHLVELELVRDERLDVDLAGEVEVDELRNLVASLHPSERRPRHAPAGDQQPRHDVERLALAGDAADGREAPAHPRRLDRLPHHVHVAGRLEGVVGAEAAGLLDEPVDD